MANEVTRLADLPKNRHGQYQVFDVKTRRPKWMHRLDIAEALQHGSIMLMDPSRLTDGVTPEQLAEDYRLAAIRRVFGYQAIQGTNHSPAARQLWKLCSPTPNPDAEGGEDPPQFPLPELERMLVESGVGTVRDLDEPGRQRLLMQVESILSMADHQGYEVGN